MTLPGGLQPAITTAVLKRKCHFLRLEDDCCAASISGRRKDKESKCLLEFCYGINLQAPGLTIFLQGQRKAGMMRYQSINWGQVVEDIEAWTNCRFEGKKNTVIVDVRSFKDLYTPENISTSHSCSNLTWSFCLLRRLRCNDASSKGASQNATGQHNQGYKFPKCFRNRLLGIYNQAFSILFQRMKRIKIRSMIPALGFVFRQRQWY